MNKQFSNDPEKSVVKNTMNAKTLVTVAAVSAALSFSVMAQAKEEEHEEHTINGSDVPAAVQQAAKVEAKGRSILRWEKEGANYESVIQKKGKQIGVENGRERQSVEQARRNQRAQESRLRVLSCGWIAL